MDNIKLSEHPWTIEPNELEKHFKTNIEKGLDNKEVEQRLKFYGSNEFTENKSRGAFGIFFHQLNNPLIIVLIIAVGLTIYLNEWVDATVIALAVIINALLGFIQEYKAERAIADLKSYVRDRVRVVRDGVEHEIDAKLLVPGDLIHVVRGTRISADARIIQETNLTVDESLLTGESLPETKSTETIPETTLLADRTNMIYAGTLTVDGSAYALVTKTGNHTEIGKLAYLVSETITEKTPLQKAVEKLTWVIMIVISLVVLAVFGVGVMQDQPVYEMLLISIAIIVGAVPESLPIGITSVLAIGVGRIAKKRGIMRSLTAAETLGSTTLIMTDKTGTLTQADMQLVDITTLSDLSEKPVPTTIRERYSGEQKELLTMALCSSDVVIENDEDDPRNWEMSGSILEKNIVKSAALHGLRLTRDDRANNQVRIPFNSKHKFSVIKINKEFLPKKYAKDNFHVVMGAPDILLGLSKMDKEIFHKTTDTITQMSENGRRLLGLAVINLSEKQNDLKPKDITELDFLGVLSFYDPIRPEVKDALQKIYSYGVKVVMATGDLPGTALNVAKEAGFIVDEKSVLTGKEIRQLNDKELTESLSYAKIFARVTPEDKLRIVRLYQNQGEIVAMTGDGVNDSPSLKAANIGVAVGSGSDVAKSVADLVLLDDNFQTIVATIEEGKRMLVNIKKIFVYLMSNSLDEVVLIGGAILSGFALPLSAIQIIWVNLFTGSIPAIAYAFDRQPVPKDNHASRSFFDGPVKFLTIGTGIVTSLLLFLLYVVLIELGIEIEVAQNVVFACFGSYILLIAFSFRNLNLPLFKYSLTENKILLYGVIGGLILLLATLYVPFLQNIFDTEALSLPWLIFVIFWLILNVAIIEGAKWISYTYLKK
ncbi:MAG: cation-transporting P-type ATPase [Candidatus Paceibacterota bacterium]